MEDMDDELRQALLLSMQELRTELLRTLWDQGPLDKAGATLKPRGSRLLFSAYSQHFRATQMPLVETFLGLPSAKRCATPRPLSLGKQNFALCDEGQHLQSKTRDPRGVIKSATSRSKSAASCQTSVLKVHRKEPQPGPRLGGRHILDS